jgi:hypothetical protein
MSTDVLLTWAMAWDISYEAIEDLRKRIGLTHPTDPEYAHADLGSESRAQANVRLEASSKGMRLWRNNNGGATDASGHFVRFGLANDSEAINKRIKSADLIGIRPVVITREHVGNTIGQFVSREIKRPGWSYTGTDRERAQAAWAQLVLALGGDAGFATGAGTL